MKFINKMMNFVTQKLQYITKMTVGEKILLKRTHLRYTQQGMAKMLNVSENTYRNIESDKKLPNKKQIEQLAKTLNMSVEDLMSTATFINYENVSDCANSNIGTNGTINIHKSVAELEQENQDLKNEVVKLKTEKEAKEKRIEDLEAIIQYQKEVIDLLKRG